MAIRYQTNLDGISAEDLRGFFVGWRSPRTPEEHLRILQGSDYIVLAIDEETGRVVGFINALGDGIQSAFIPLLEVLPEYKRQGIGGTLVRRMLEELKHYPCVDLTCDPDVQPFYEKLGLMRSVGMVVRRY